MELRNKVNRRPRTRCPAYLSLLAATAVLFTLVTASPAAENETLKLKHLRTLNNDFAVTTLVWHPDGKQLAVGQVLNKRIAIWDTQTGERIRTLEKEGGGVQSIAYSPNGKHLAVGREFSRHTKDHAHVHLYDAQSGVLLHSFVPPSIPAKGDSNDASALAFSPDGKYLVASGYGSGRTAVVYQIATRKPIHTLSDSDEKGFRVINAIAFSPDNRFIALGRVGGRIDVWSALDWKLVKRLEGLNASVHALAFSPTAKYLAAGTTIGDRWISDGENRKRQIIGKFDDDVVVWETSTLRKVFQFPARYNDSGIGIAIHYVQFGLSDNFLFIVSRGGTMQVVDIKTGETVLFQDDFKKVPHAAINSNSHNIAIGLQQKIEIHEILTR